MDRLYQDCTLLHVDADGFFASVEQALTPAWRGLPLVTGAERGIIAAANYEAKALGIKRGLQLHEARRLAPHLVVVPSDYEAYSLYSQRLFDIVRRFTPHVEEYSIDEAFADLSGCSGVLGLSLAEVAAQLREMVRCELGVTVSVGISLTKTLAKLCSKFRKPDGQTILCRAHLPLLLQRTAIDQVWGIGPASAAKLQRRGITTAATFVAMPAAAVVKLLHKPGFESWSELQGKRCFALDSQARATYDSMMQGHTFAPPTTDRQLVLAEALQNATKLAAKLRRRHHLARVVGLYLRYRDYGGVAAELKLPFVTASSCEIIPAVSQLFAQLHVAGGCYRATTVWVAAAVAAAGRQPDLFEEIGRRHRRAELDQACDALNQRYGSGTLFPATLLELARKAPHSRDRAPERQQQRLPYADRQRLAIPRLTLPPESYDNNKSRDTQSISTIYPVSKCPVIWP